MTAQKNKKILIVDDNPMNITVLMRILSPYYKIYATKNGRDALQVAEEQIPDLILLDVIMEDMDGYDVIAALKTTESLKHIPVMFLSSKTEVEDHRIGLAAGAVDYLFKPFDRDILLRQIDYHIRKLI